MTDPPTTAAAPTTAAGPTTAAAPDSPSPGGSLSTPAPRLLCDTQALTLLSAVPAGELWKLSAPGRDLDAGITHLLPGQRMDAHAAADPNVLLLILAGDAVLSTPQGPRPLTAGSLLWLPHGSTADLTAGENGLSCLAVHRRLPDAPIHRTQDGAPRQRPGTSPVSPDDTTPSDWPKWLC